MSMLFRKGRHTMVGIGVQEMLVLAVCCGAPIIAGGVAVIVFLFAKPGRKDGEQPISRDDE